MYFCQRCSLNLNWKPVTCCDRFCNQCTVCQPTTYENIIGLTTTFLYLWVTNGNNSWVVAEMGDRLTTRDMGKKSGLLYPFPCGVAGSPSNTTSPGLRPTSLPSGILIHPAVWPQQTWAKNWQLCPFGGEPGPRPTRISSGILIHSAVWPQYTNATDRQRDRQTWQTMVR